MLCHVFRKVQTILHPLHLTHRFDGGIQQTDVGDSVQAVIRKVIVLIVVTDQVIPAIGGRHLIGIDDVLPLPAGMQFLVRTIAIVGERNLFALCVFEPSVW